MWYKGVYITRTCFPDVLFSDDPPDDVMAKIISRPIANRRRNQTVGDMNDETRQLLYKFYQPFNEDLARLSGNENLNYGLR